MSTSESKLQELLRKMDEVCARLQEALDDAHGDQQDPRVKGIADEFDRLLTEYTKFRHPS